MRIIAGKYKNRVIPTLRKSDYRPSTAKFREALFSILSSGEFADTRPVIGANVLDLFAGTGGFSFEALSRGADSVLLIDNKEEHLKIARDFARKIGAEDKVAVLLTDATNLPKPAGKYDLVFIDPPYYNDYVTASLDSLIKRQWLENSAIIVIEMETRQKLKLQDNLGLVKEKLYGNNKLLILKYEQG